MTKQNIKRDKIIVTFGDGVGNIIAVCIRILLKDGSLKYELYKTDNKLSYFDYVTSSVNPYEFDKILYKNKINTASNNKNNVNSNSISDLTQKQSKRLF